MRCLSEEEVYDYCLDLEESVANPGVARHLAECRPCSQLFERTRRLHASLRSSSGRNDGPPGADDPGQPETIGGHTVRRLIGSGGMGTVWQAHDTVLDRLVAIKVIRPDLRDDPKFAESFLSEAKHVARLDHPNIVRVFSAGRHDDGFYLEMEYVDGRTLSEVGLPDDAARGAVFRQLLLAMRYAHRQGIIHRDIKSSNVMVTPDGRAKMLDFGLSRSESSDVQHTTTGAVIGTIPYLAPELARGGRSSVQSDIYALGLVLHELATGCNPYQGGSPLEMLERIKTEPIRADDAALARFSPPFRAFVARMTAPELSERYAGLDEVLRDFDHLPESNAGSLTQAPTVPWSPPGVAEAPEEVVEPEPPGALRSRWWPAAVVALVLVAGLAFFLTRPGSDPGGETLPYTWLEIPAAELADGGMIRLAILPARNETGRAELDESAQRLTDRLLASIVQRTTPSRVEIDRTGRFIAGRDIGSSSALDPYLATLLGREGLDVLLAATFVETGGETRIQVRLLSAESGQLMAEETLPLGSVDQVPETLETVARAVSEKI